MAAKRVHASQVRAIPGGRYPASDWGGHIRPERSKVKGGYDALGGAPAPRQRRRVPKT
jgi:hypothetical protein